MNILEEIDFVKSYNLGHRGVGHTLAAIEVVKNTPGAKFIVGSSEQGVWKKYGLDDSQVISLQNLENLRGQDGVLVWDNFAWMLMLEKARQEIVKLRQELEEKK